CASVDDRPGDARWFSFGLPEMPSSCVIRNPQYSTMHTNRATLRRQRESATPQTAMESCAIGARNGVAVRKIARSLTWRGQTDWRSSIGDVRKVTPVCLRSLQWGRSRTESGVAMATTAPHWYAL